MSLVVPQLEILSRREQLRALLTGWLPWVGKGSLAVLDQGLISGSNFLIGILLARWLAPAAYGAYALAFAIFILLSLFYQALILEPMYVFGPSQYRNCQREYLGNLLWIHGGLVLPIAIILATAAWAVHLAVSSSSLPGALAGVTLAAPCVLLYWLARGAFYVKLAPHVAVSGAVLYCALVLGGLWVVYQRGLLSPFSAFLLMGLGALVVSGQLLIRLRPALKRGSSDGTVSAVWREHWKYGRWALAGSVMAWIPWNIPYILVSSFSGMAGAGELKALLNLTLPVAQGSTAVFLLAQPYASGVQSREGAGAIGKVTRKVTLLFTCIAGAYWVLVTALRRPIVFFLYGGHYVEVGHLVPWVALASVLAIVAYGPTIALRAMQSPASVFVAYGASGAIALAVGIPATRSFGLRGVILSIILSSAGTPLIELVLLRRKLRGCSKGS
jgi:O-antigen/teichoic acid export membrane protein